MPNPFAITAAASTIRLDAGRQGDATFTVTNNSTAPIRGRARVVVPDKPEAAGWYAVTGDVERDFPAGGTQQYIVKLVLPPSVPPGHYTFRLDAVGVANPDEEFTTGPTVAVEVAGAAVPPPRGNRGYLATLGGAVVGALAGMTAGVILGVLLGLLLGEHGGLNAFFVFLALGPWLGAAVGSAGGLRLRGREWGVETAGILAGLGLLGIGLVFLIIKILSGSAGSPTGIAAFLAVCVVPGLVLVSLPLAARALVRLWKAHQI